MLIFPVRELLSEPELTLDQWLSLDGAPASQILLRAELKVGFYLLFSYFFCNVYHSISSRDHVQIEFILVRKKKNALDHRHDLAAS